MKSNVLCIFHNQVDFHSVYVMKEMIFIFFMVFFVFVHSISNVNTEQPSEHIRSMRKWNAVQSTHSTALASNSWKYSTISYSNSAASFFSIIFFLFNLPHSFPYNIAFAASSLSPYFYYLYSFGKNSVLSPIQCWSSFHFHMEKLFVIRMLIANLNFHFVCYLFYIFTSFSPTRSH